jgi:hypothetical protein
MTNKPLLLFKMYPEITSDSVAICTTRLNDANKRILSKCNLKSLPTKTHKLTQMFLSIHLFSKQMFQ